MRCSVSSVACDEIPCTCCSVAMLQGSVAVHGQCVASVAMLRVMCLPIMCCNVA